MQPIRNVETGEVFGSIKEAAEFYGITPHSISSALYTGCAAGTYHWKRVTKKKAKRHQVRKQANQVIKEVQQPQEERFVGQPLEQTKTAPNLAEFIGGMPLPDGERQALYRLVVDRLSVLEREFDSQHQFVQELNDELQTQIKTVEEEKTKLTEINETIAVYKAARERLS